MIGEEGKRGASTPEEVLSYWFPKEDIFATDLENFGRQMRWWFGGGPEVDRHTSPSASERCSSRHAGESWIPGPRPREGGWR